MLANPLEGVQVNQDIGQGIVIGNGRAIAQFGAFDAESYRLAVDAFGSGALLVNGLELLALSIHLVAQTSAFPCGQGGDAALFGPILVVTRFMGVSPDQPGCDLLPF